MKAIAMEIQQVTPGMFITEDEALEEDSQLENADWQRVLSDPHVSYANDRVQVALAFYDGTPHVEFGHRGQTVAVMCDDDLRVVIGD